MASRVPATNEATIANQYIDDADGAGAGHRSQLCRHLTGEAARPRRELDYHVVNGTQLVQGYLGHQPSFVGPELNCRAAEVLRASSPYPDRRPGHVIRDG